MRTYYRGPDAIVTDEHFVWRGSTGNHLFAVPDLRSIVIVRGPLDGPLHTPALAAGAGLLALATTSWFLFGPAVGYTALAAAVLVSLMIMSIAGRRSAHRWHLRGTYRGSVVTIYASANLRVFNQVTRALRRSVENTHRTHTREDFAAA